MPSTVIEHFTYDPEQLTLKITFRSGNVYVYKQVPEYIYEELQIAGSKGQYFNNFIKNIYDYERLTVLP